LPAKSFTRIVLSLPAMLFVAVFASHKPQIVVPLRSPRRESTGATTLNCSKLLGSGCRHGEVGYARRQLLWTPAENCS